MQLTGIPLDEVFAFQELIKQEFCCEFLLSAASRTPEKKVLNCGDSRPRTGFKAWGFSYLWYDPKTKVARQAIMPDEPLTY